MANEELYEELAFELQQAISDPVPERGNLGYTVDGVYSVVSIGDQSKFRVRFPDGTWADIPHLSRVPPEPDLPVLIEEHRGRQIIKSTDPDLIETFAAGRSGNINVGRHGHERFSGMEFQVNLRLIEQLSVRVIGGMTVYVNQGRYDIDGSMKWWMGDSYDLTSHIPSTPAKHRWVIIGINPLTEPHSLVVENGPEVATIIPLTPDMLTQISFMELGYIPVCGVQLRYNQVKLVEKDFEALFSMVSLSGSSAGNILKKIMTDINGTTLVDIDGCVMWE